jgi:hypothetical protein
MKHTPFAPDLPDAQPLPDDFSSDGAAPNHLRNQISDATHELVGPQMDGAQGYQGARNSVSISLPTS